MASSLGDMWQVEQHAIRTSNVTEPGGQGSLLAACWVPSAEPSISCLLCG